MKSVTHFIEMVRTSVEEALSDSPQFNPSPETCRWCLAKSECDAITERNFNFLSKFKSGVEDFSEMTIEEHSISEILDNADFIRDWLKNVEQYAMDQLRAGKDIPHYRLVDGRAKPENWTNESEAKTFFFDEGFSKEDFITEKLISPSQAKKLTKIPKSLVKRDPPNKKLERV
jgi:hypothetical protein